MQADKELVYSTPNWQETLKTFKPIQDNISKIALEPYPDVKVLAAFAKLAYSDCTGKLDLPKGWQLLTTARNNSWTNGYFGCAFWSPSEQQVAIAHRGTDPKKLGAIWIDGKGVYCNKYTQHMSSSVSFADDIKNIILEINQLHGSRFVVSFTGHSLGAWLAGVTTLTLKHLKREGSGFRRIANSGQGIHAHTLALDSPGVEDMLTKICKDYDLRYNRSMRAKQLDISNFFAAPNLVNTTGFHVGQLHQVHITRVALPSDSKKPTLTSNMDTHNLDKFIEAFKDGSGIYDVQNWPQGFPERKNYHELEMFCNSYILHLDAGQVSSANSNGSYQNTQTEGNTGGLRLEQTSPLQYRTIPSLGNFCHLGVFSEDEFNFLQNWRLFQSNALIKLTEIEKFTFDQKLEKLDLPKFKLDIKRNTITCETKEDLVKVIGQTKQLLRWFSSEIMAAVDKQNCKIKAAPLYMAGQVYLRTLPDILDCEDTLGLEKFLESSVQRVLQIETSDHKFEAARIYNITNNLKNTSLDARYLEETCRTMFCCDITRDVDIEGINKSDVTSDNLLILDFVSPTDNLNSNYRLLKRLLKNLEMNRFKKLVLIVSQQIPSQLFMDFKFTVICKPFAEFSINDLALNSREEILTRDVIALGEETLSLNTLLGIDFISNDEQVPNKINILIFPILKKLATDPRYIAKIPNKLPRLCELDAVCTKGNKRVCKEKLIALLERNGANGPLLVISDPERLSQDYWGEGTEAALGRIFISDEDGQNLFMEKRREESARVIYLLRLCAEGLTLREVYNGGLYMPRKFHTRFTIKSVEAFVRYNGNKEQFIFNDMEDKLTFISSFKLSKEAEDLFVLKNHFKIQIHFRELNIETNEDEELFNKHYFKKLEIGGTPCLVWQYSHGSLDGLRPFITRDYSDPIEEGVFSNMRTKITIIADDPGMGKTTSLTRMSELIRDSWVLRIDHNHLTSALNKLPSKLNLQSVTKCLIHASGLPTDDDFLRSLLQHCLESENSRQICILVDAFDEIAKEKTNLVKFLKYLKNTTRCKTVVTTRGHSQEGLENELSQFSAVLEKITEKQQDDYIVNLWLPHLALQLPEYGESEKGRLLQFARELREEVEGVLGEDVASFMGIPLQIRMLAEVFLQQAIQSVVSPEQAQNFCKITNLYDLYKQFIEVKKTIFFEQKTNLNTKLPTTILNEMVKNIMDKHCVLAFQSIDPKFAAEYFTNTIISKQELKDISGLGLILARIDGTFSFIHRTFEEYFCADFFVQWIRHGRQTKENNTLVKNELCVFLLKPEYYIIREFIETQLEISPPTLSDTLEDNPTLYQSWSEHRQLFFNDNDNTPLHVAAVEQNLHTFAVLLSGPSSRISDEDYICFMAARDKAGRTALNIALENGNLNIVKLFSEYTKSFSYESILKIILATFLDTGDDRNENLFREYCSNTQPSSCANKASIRTDLIRKQITSFMAAVRDNDYSAVQNILSGMENDTERAYLLIAIDSQGDTAINLAASKNEYRLFKLFAKQGVCMSNDKHERTPFHCASEKGHVSIVKYLLNQSKETYDSITENTSLIKYVLFKTCYFLQKFVNDDNLPGEVPKHNIYSFITSQDKNGDTALTMAAENGHQEIVGILLEHGMKDCSRNHYGLTALSLAAHNGHFEIVHVLLKHGADINSIDNNANTALIFSSENGHRAVVNVLLQHGGDVHYRNSMGVNALMKAVFKGHQEIVCSLLQHGADISSKNQFGFNPLSLAAYKGHRDIVNILLNHDGDVNCENNHGNTALTFAAQKGHKEVVAVLIQHGADINKISMDGATPLIIAAQKGHQEVIRMLIQHGADINAKNVNGNTALMLSADKGHHEVMSILLKHGANIGSRNNTGNTALSFAAFNGNIESSCKLLIHNGDHINYQNNKGNTALHWAAFKGHREIVSQLLDHGADIHSRCKVGWTALNVAAGNGHQDIVKSLLLNGADLNSRDEDGDTPFLQAAANGHAEMAVLLLQRGVDVNSQRDDGRTALSWAALKGYVNVVEVLLQHNADVSCQDKDGKTALIWAEDKGHGEVVELLRSHQEADPME